MQSETLKTDKHIQQQPENTALLLWIESRKVTEPPNGITQERKTTIRIVSVLQQNAMYFTAYL